MLFEKVSIKTISDNIETLKEEYPLLYDNYINHHSRYFDEELYYKVNIGEDHKMDAIFKLKHNYKKKNSLHLDFIEVAKSKRGKQIGMNVINHLINNNVLFKIFTVSPIDIKTMGKITTEFYIKKLHFKKNPRYNYLERTK